MKLYSANLSPFAARCRLAIYMKDLPVAIDYPPGGGLKSPEFLAINPLGKAPCLATDTGAGIPESYVILEYLAEKFPEAGLLGETAEARAKVRSAARIAELYVATPAYVLHTHMKPEARDQAVVDATMDRLVQGLGWVEDLLGADGFLAGSDFTIADCVFIPVAASLPRYAAAFGRPDLLEGRPKLAAYVERMKAIPAVAKVLKEVDEARAVFLESGKIT